MTSFETSSAKETLELAEKLLPDILSKKIVLLSGPLGSGKTTFVKGIAKALGIVATISSPTFSYRNAYPGLTHFDLYRLPETLRHFPELEEEIEQTKNIVVVEWPEKVDLKIDALLLKFSTLEDGRHRIERCDTLDDASF